MSSPEYDWTIKKLYNLIKELESCSRNSDYSKANELLESLRRYDQCAYCIKYRSTLENRGYRGCCGDCPCHKIGEYLSGRKRSYNGCYIAGPYKDMVKTAFQFGEDPCKEFLDNVILEIHRTIEMMKKFEKEL